MYETGGEPRIRIVGLLSNTFSCLMTPLTETGFGRSDPVDQLPASINDVPLVIALANL